MKVIDLLNKIANDEELPKRIKYKNIVYKLAGTLYINDKETDRLLDYLYADFRNLNDEVEILEDEEIDIREIEELCNRSDEYFSMLSEEAKICWLNKYQQENKDKINEIIRVVNKLVEKKEK